MSNTHSNHAANRDEASHRLPRKHRDLAIAAALVVAGLMPVGTAGAKVQVDRVARGSASIQQNGNSAVIRASNGAVINFKKFDLASGQSVQFIQPSASSRVLNRITSGVPSTLDGKLSANGIVYFLNPAGVLFGPHATINASRFVAGAANMSDSDFANGINRFTAGSGSVRNEGTISAGGVMLVGQHVANAGSIVANDGLVVMQAGGESYLGTSGSALMVKLPEGATAQAGVENSGSIKAVKVVLGAGDIYSFAVRQTGTIKAKDVTLQATGGTIVAGGSIDASSASGKGGTVKVLAPHVAVVGATIDASGPAGGGTILIGGDAHGTGPIPTAKTTLVTPDSTLNADATSNGNGGKIVAWSDDITAFHGKASARGGPAGGNGGFIETSGHDLQTFNAVVNASAPKGIAGQWLLDPVGVLVVDPNDAATLSKYGTSGLPVPFSSNVNLPTVSATGTDPLSFVPKTTDRAVLRRPGATRAVLSLLNIAEVNTALNSGTNITITSGTDTTNTGGRIVVDSPIQKTTGGDVTLLFNSTGGVDLLKDVTSTSGKLNVNIITDDLNPAVDPANLTDLVANLVNVSGSRIVTNGGNFTVTVNTPTPDHIPDVGSFEVQFNLAAGGAGSVFQTGGGDLNVLVRRAVGIDRLIETGGGNISISAVGIRAALEVRSALQTGGGNVFLKSTADLRFKDIVTGNGGVRIWGDSDGGFTDVVEQYFGTRIDAGTGDVALIGPHIVLFGDGIKGGAQVYDTTQYQKNADFENRLEAVKFPASIVIAPQLSASGQSTYTFEGTTASPIRFLGLLESGLTSSPGPVLSTANPTKVLVKTAGVAGADINFFNGTTTYVNAAGQATQNVVHSAALGPSDWVFDAGRQGDVRLGGMGVGEVVKLDSNGQAIVDSADVVQLRTVQAPVNSIRAIGRDIFITDMSSKGAISLEAQRRIVVRSTGLTDRVNVATNTGFGLTQQVINATNGTVPLFGQPVLPFRTDTADADQLAFVEYRPVSFKFAANNPTYDLRVSNDLQTTPISLELPPVTIEASPQPIANVIASAIPQAVRSPEQSATVSGSVAKDLYSLGIFARDVTPDERFEALVGRAVYDDIPKTPEPRSRDYKVAAARLPSESAKSAIATYRTVFLKPVIDPTTNKPALDAKGEIRQQDQRPRIKQVLQKAVSDYLKQPGNTRVNPTQFSAFIETNPAEVEARGYVRQLRTLLAQVQQLGLTPTEQRVSREVLLRDITPAGMTQADLETTILKSRS